MTDDPQHRMPHLLGLTVALSAFGLLVLGWVYGLPMLEGTPIEEFRYMLFAGFAIGLLSGLQTLISHIFK